jgi:Right handed beta helix region
MPAPYALPPDTRAVGSGNPPADMNAATDCLNALATAVAGIAGASGRTGFAGGGMSGAPVSGAYTAGQFITNQDGTVWNCTASGSPGTWAQAVRTGTWQNAVTAYGVTASSESSAVDTTTTMQAAFNGAVAANLPLYLPAGIYAVSSLTIPAGLILHGDYSGTFPGDNTIPAVTEIMRLASTNTDLLTAPDGNNYFQIFDIALNGNSNNNTSGIGIKIADAAVGQECQAIIERCFVRSNPGSNLYLGAKRRACRIVNSTFMFSAAGDGITIASTDHFIYGCIIGSNFRCGIAAGTTISNNFAASSPSSPANDVQIFGNNIYQNQVGIAISQSSANLDVAQNVINVHTLQGITVYDGYANVITENLLHSNGTLTNNTYGHIDVGSAVASVDISDNAFGVPDAGITNFANYCVNMQSFANTAAVYGNIGTMAPTSTVSGLLVGPSAAAPAYVRLSNGGALIQGAGNDVLNLRNSSGTQVTKVTSGGSLVHTGGALQLSGHYIALLTVVPGIANGTYCTAAAVTANSSDIGGIITATMVASPLAGSLVVVTFHGAFTNVPAVVIIPATIAAAQIQAYVTVTNTGFTISEAVTPPAAVNSAAVSWHYVVIGQNA